MTAIVTALRSITITRLELTHNQLPSILKRTIKEMEALLDPSDNHRAYVATLRNSRNQPCIPFLSKYVPYSTQEPHLTFGIKSPIWTTCVPCFPKKIM